jgi:hypothetical protein
MATSFDYAKYLFTKEVLIGNNHTLGALDHFKEKTYIDFNTYLINHRINQSYITDYIYTIIQRPTKFHEIYNDLLVHSIEKLNIFNSIVFKIFSIENDMEEQLDSDIDNIINNINNL